MQRQPVRQGSPVPGYNRHPGSIWIDENRAVLPNNTWVAADDSGLVAKETSIDGLLKAIEAGGKKPDQVAIAFITKDSA